MSFPVTRSRFFIILPATLALLGCDTLDHPGSTGFLSGLGASTAHASASSDHGASFSARDDRISHQLVESALKALADGDLDTASQRANAALKFDITNPRLQFLNAYVYQQMGIRGDTSKYELAEQGYLEALKFDPGNMRAQRQLGILYMAQRKYTRAKAYFAAVALDDDNDPALLYDLAKASYYARDPQTAEAVLKQLSKIAPDMLTEPGFVQALSLATAAVNDDGEANALIDRYQQTLTKGAKLSFVKRRLRNWRDFYEYDASRLVTPVSMTKIANDEDSEDDEDKPSKDTSKPEAKPADVKSKSSDMVVVEVVLIGTQEDARQSRGTNLLDGLQLQFGDTLENTPGFSFGQNRVNDALGSGLAENTQTVTSFINIPAIRYSLNIANALDSYGEILAKPSLVAQSGETSQFFSGTEVLAAAVSGGDGDSVSVEKEVGVKLAITPTVLDDGKVRLHVAAERTFLTDPSTSVLFQFRLDTTKTNINSTVTMNFDQTLVIGGLTEKATSGASDGVPIVRDIPGINLFFSQKSSRVFQRSVLILITPRRPEYTTEPARATSESEKNLNTVERDLERFQQRHRDWFTPRDKLHLVKNSEDPAFTEEFHMNDIPALNWKEADGTSSNSANNLKHYLLAGDT